ncbi:MAG: ribbon-helix-helix protein, CopG family [Ruminococcus sp.]|nr:ribbon-helix-helix protein, CopG family [Ruminococcus sp.]
MKRSTYSVVLMDDVVAAIDALAAQMGTSRSNLMNQILAEHVCCITPEKRMRSIFSYVEQQMNDAFRIQLQASDAMLSVQSSLRYKYRPTIRYSVELLRSPKNSQIGWLRITCRTQSQSLIHTIHAFFQLWIKLERAYDPDKTAEREYQLLPGRMIRSLHLSEPTTEEQLGTAIGDYIRMIDAVMKTYFSELLEQTEMNTCLQAVESQFVKELPKLTLHL